MTRLIFFALLLLVLPACSRWDARGVTPLPPQVQRGVSLAHNYQHRGTRGYGSPTSKATLAELRALGVSWISLMPFGFMPSPTSDQVKLVTDHPAGESDERLRGEIAAAHALGLKVMLKPQLWIAGGAFSGTLRPAGASEDPWAAWFASYERFLLHYAELAAAQGAELLCIGVELGSATAAQAPRFQALIAKVRVRYPGPLVYAANWDEVHGVPFWGALDYIGVQLYAPLADAPGRSDAVLAGALRQQLDRLEALSQQTGKPVLLTEVGYKALPDTAVTPHAWPEHLAKDRGTDPGQADEAAQAQAYRVLLLAVGARPFVRGLYIWKWFTDPETDEEPAWGFSPRGKRAAAVLRRAYAQPESS